MNKTIEEFLGNKLPYPVKTRNIRFFLISEPNVVVPTLQLPQSFMLGWHTTINSWKLTEVIQKPKPGGSFGVWLTDSEALDSIKLILTEVFNSKNSGALPTYIIVHLEELSTQKPLLYHLNTPKKHHQIDEYAVDLQKKLVEDVQDLLMQVMPKNSEWSANAFSHYDPDLQTRGWLTISPNWAIVAGVGSKEVRVLMDQLQHHDIDTQNKGIHNDRYQDFLNRVIQWNTNCDVLEVLKKQTKS